MDTLRPLLFGMLCIDKAIIAVAGIIGLLLANRKKSQDKVTVNPNWPRATGVITTARVEATVLINLESKTRHTLTQYSHRTLVNLYYSPEKPNEAQLIKR